MVFSCKPAATVSPQYYEEDLSIHRQIIQEDQTDEEDFQQYFNETNKAGEKPDVSKDVIFKGEITTQAKEVLDTLKHYSLKRGFVEGYTVQVYNGRSREEAYQAREKLYKMTNEEHKITYVQPNFKVKVGHYIERLKALQIKKDLESEFPAAIVIPERISIR